MRTLTLLILLSCCLATSGCATDADGNKSVSLDPFIGLLGMAIDGDDKDDYQHMLSDDCDKCSGRCRCDD